LSAFSLERAGRWLLDSGIQEPSGGVARFYRAETGRNKPVSTEITGYTTSALIYLFDVTGEEIYLARARQMASFLIEHAWDRELRTFPFEHPSPSPESDHHAYFFDCGIIIRGLLAVWRKTRDGRLLEVSLAASHSMIEDFHSGNDFHPILALPSKVPLARTEQWSRMPGCYQLKSALAWWDVSEATGDTSLRDAYLEMLCSALERHASYLPGSSNQYLVMYRLHPYCYFLEALTPVLDRPECGAAYTHGLEITGRYLRQLAPAFARSDVYAQLLRARVYGANVVPIDCAAAAEEAEALAGYQAVSEQQRIDGGFYFGQREGEMSPHVNPVSTAFALQALEMWRVYQHESSSAGSKPPCRHLLI
jgi:hypothetical protein